MTIAYPSAHGNARPHSMSDPQNAPASSRQAVAVSKPAADHIGADKAGSTQGCPKSAESGLFKPALPRSIEELHRVVDQEKVKAGLHEKFGKDNPFVEDAMREASDELSKRPDHPSPEGFFTTTAKNRIRTWIRNWWTTPENNSQKLAAAMELSQPLQPDEAILENEKTTQRKELLAKLEAAIARLPEKERILLRLKYFHELSTEQIARKRGDFDALDEKDLDKTSQAYKDARARIINRLDARFSRTVKKLGQDIQRLAKSR